MRPDMPASIMRPAAALLLLGAALPVRAQTAQPVCVPRIPAAVVMSIDGTVADWDLFQPQVITYNAAATDTTRLAADATHLYFHTTVRSGVFTEFSSQRFTIAAGPNRMLRVMPFNAAPPPAGVDDKAFPATAFANNIFPGTWDTGYALPTLPTTDFHRFFITSGATPHWRLEGRIPLADLNIASIDNFDLFLHISSGSVPAQQKSWPGPVPADLGDPGSVTFGANRCPDIGFSQPYLSFGKKQFPSSNPLGVTVSNTGAAGSVLSIPSAPVLSGDGSFGALTLLKGGSPPPFTLTTAETATLSVVYTPSTATTLASPHTATVTIASNDPDENPVTVPVQGLARPAVDLLFILDQSGSMLTDNKWNSTKWATEVVHEAARLFSIPADRVGALWFGGPSATPQAGLLRSLSGFTANPASFTAGFSQEADNAFYTPIGLGVTEAHNRFQVAGSQLNLGLLMSDGIHNRPLNTYGATTVAGLNLAAAVSGNTKNMRISTVALGTASGVSADLLDNIRAHYGGGATTYNITAQPEALAEVFTEALSEQFFTNRVGFDGGVGGFPIPQGADSVLAMIAWTPGNAPADIQLRIHEADGADPPLETITASSAGVIYHQGGDATQPFTYVLITDPARFTENRVWKITNAGGGAIAAAVGVPIVLEDLKIIGHFTAEQPAKGTGNDYVLRARLTEVGAPVTDAPAHPVAVTAHLARPGEGLGHLASTVSLQTCGTIRPALPPVPGKGSITGARELPRFGGRRAVVPAGLDTTQNDPHTYLYAWANAYVGQCDPDGLAVLQEPGLILRDDGTQGDDVAGDGTYTLRFPSTDYEGSYVVRYNVVGTTPTGARFSRTRSMATYVPVAVDPAHSSLDQRIWAQSGGTTIWEYYIAPRDRFRRYMGPGKADRVSFAVVGGSGVIVDSTFDYNNGYYSALVRQDAGQPVPQVEVTVDGTRIRGGSARDRHMFELGVHGSMMRFDTIFDFDDSPGFGAHIGIRLLGFMLEAEGDVTTVDDVVVFSDRQESETVAGKVFTLFGNARLDLGTGALVPFVKAGYGKVLFRDFLTDDDANAYQAGAGASLWLGPAFGVRAQFRAMRFEDVFGAGGNTMNYRVTAGAVLRF